MFDLDGIGRTNDSDGRQLHGQGGTRRGGSPVGHDLRGFMSAGRGVVVLVVVGDDHLVLLRTR